MKNAQTKCDAAKYPFVSVIIPTYNRPSDLKMAVCSLLSQDYPKERFEVIVVDNASDDASERLNLELMHKLDRQLNLKYIYEQRKGSAFARNTGAAHAESDILLFTDDDALFDENWISAIVEVYRQYPEVGAVGTKILVKWDRQPENWVHQYEGVLGRLDWTKNVVVRRDIEIFGGSLSIRKEIFAKVHGFNPGQNGDYLIGDEDSGLCRKLFSEGVLIGLTPFTTLWHVQKVSKNATLNDLKRRYTNWGITDAYGATFYNWKCSQLLKDVFLKTSNAIFYLFQTLRSRNRKAICRYMVLDMNRLRYYLLYLWRYRTSKSLKRQIMKKDWEFGPDYKAPPLQCRSKLK